MSDSAKDTIEVAPGVHMPRIGFGVYKSPPETCVASCLEAIKDGYTLIDSAMYYANEREVGEAIRKSGVDRKDLFVTTKIIAPPEGKDPEETYQAVLKATDKFGIDYVDLFLIHTPTSGPEGRKVMWQALERLLDNKKTRAIGVSNYGQKHLEELKSYAKAKIAVNQIELHPWCQSREHVKYCEEIGIPLQAYCPIVRASKNDHPVLQKLASKHNKEPTQILIRWSLQKGYIPLPKSDTPSRIKSNIDVYGFKLDNKDMAELDALDEGGKGACAPYNLNCP
ncbi:hypothetical protein EMMF5_006031 [Cystobasidiomycetes sp. EMM_F5]